MYKDITVKVVNKATDKLVAVVEVDESELSYVLRDLSNAHPGCRVFHNWNS